MMNGDCMLKMRSGLPVTGYDCPLIRQHKDFIGSHRDHGFNCNAKTILYHLTITAFTVVRYSWIFVHLLTNAMTNKLTNDSVAIAFAVLLYSITNIADSLTSK